MDAGITMQLLEITKMMLDSGKQFHLSITIKGGNSNFTFSTGSQDQENLIQPKPEQKTKHKSKSQIKRNAIRMQKFLDKEQPKSPPKNLSDTQNDEAVKENMLKKS